MKKYIFALLTAVLFTSAYADQPKVYAKDSVVFNRTFADWSVAWRQWADSMPALAHPLFNRPPPAPPGTPAAPCSEGQSGPVWFLGGLFCNSNPGTVCDFDAVVRSCDIPEGVTLYFPILNFGCLDAEAAAGHCGGAGPLISQMRQVIAGIDQVTGLHVSVDGNSINGNLRKDFRVQSNVYTTLVPDGNLYQAIDEPEVTKGTYVGVDDGIYVMLKPLPKGHHELKFRGSAPGPFNLDVTYDLHVQ